MKVAHILTYKSCCQVLHSSIRYKISSFLDNFVHFFIGFGHFFTGLDNFVHFFIRFSHFFMGLDNFVHFFIGFGHFFTGLDNFVHFFIGFGYFFTSLDNFVHFFFVLGHSSLSTFFFISGQLCPLFYQVWTILSNFLSGLVTFLWVWTI